MKILKMSLSLLIISVISISCEPEEIYEEMPVANFELSSDTGGTQEKPIDDKKG